MKNQTTSPDEKSPAQPIVTASANGSIDSATLKLLASWRVEDAAKNPEEVLAAEKELAEFKKAMNENRAYSGEPILYP
jgi:hypothetical protein